MLDDFFNDKRTIDRLRQGPLGAHLDAFAAHLSGLGYATHVPTQVRVAGRLANWMRERGLSTELLSQDRLQEFERDPISDLRADRGDRKTLYRLVAFLRSQGAIPYQEREDPDQAAQTLESFERYLLVDRGLSSETVRTYKVPAERFLRAQSSNLSRITGAEVCQFVLDQASRVSSRTATCLVSGLRAFLRFLHLSGQLEARLWECVPAVADRSRSGLPKYLPAEQIQRLLAGVDRSRPAGRRDYAVLLLLARLGLRGGEVARMNLEDINWESGELCIRGKSRRGDILPLPVDVGEAISDYLLSGRPPCTSRRVFIRCRAPYTGFSGTCAVGDILRHALGRAGLNPPRKGSCLLRHSLATEMLRGGASLPEIGDILRHRRLDTVAIYAKVDVLSLRSLARPWPGVANG